MSVPTSAGHKFESSSLLTMSSVLSSMSPGVTVVGLDDGCAAAFSSARVLQASNRINKLKSDHALKLAMASVESVSELLPEADDSEENKPRIASIGKIDSQSSNDNIDTTSWGAIDSDSLSIASMNGSRNGPQPDPGNEHTNGNAFV